jgi:hypothetical protein
MLYGMKRSWLRRILTPLLGLVFAASMSVSAVQATEMVAKMTMAPAMATVTHDGKCPDCDHGSGDAKAMNCRLAVCSAPAVATLAPALVIAVRTDGHDLPVPTQSSLVGWAYPPDPYPPRSRTPG